VAVSILIDQAGKPAGVAGQSREDLDTGVAVTLTAVGGPFLRYRWSIVSKPVDVVASTRSGATLSAATAAVTLCSPIDLRGTHLVELLVDAGFGLGGRAEDQTRRTFYAGDPLLPLSADPTLLPRRVPAFGERAEHNAPDALDPLGNPDGWARELERWKSLIRGDHEWAAAKVTTAAGPTAVLGRRKNVASVTWNVGSNAYDVVFSLPLPDAGYSARVTPFVPLLTLAVPLVDSASVTAAGFSVQFLDATATPVTADFGFSVSLGADP
jgi:hypothetical protein